MFHNYMKTKLEDSKRVIRRLKPKRDSTMTKRKGTKRQPMVDKTLHTKVTIE